MASFGGEQFALPEAIDYLRGVRHAGNQDVEVVVSAADPLNLSGIVTPGDKVPALLRNRVHYRNGIPVGAWLRGDYVHLAGAPTGIGDMPHFGEACPQFLPGNLGALVVEERTGLVRGVALDDHNHLLR